MSSQPRALTVVGDLSDPEPAPAPDDGDEPVALLEAVRAVRAGDGDMDELLALFRDTEVYIETSPVEGGTSVSTVSQDGLNWLPVYTTLERMAAGMVAAGRGAEDVGYAHVLGADLLDGILHALPYGTGLVLDPLAEHVFALPPVSGIVAEPLAVDGQEQHAS
ncbi:hypothetical protein FHX42_005232 [Saccharopolyspora lacisalsi]|uniref:SseB protein N-terminal domain-containing protein n=1 Tax=Halosaccharopolyspora lacisalsi TaxID=1000566 RepID=A0A839E7D8_9PSEU|nr:SseB family protein [Halosaccharopolyspora lacisalsi]MBA8827825.1 hypothetical protein [Halosaccharopolyspora lacisalsi]